MTDDRDDDLDRALFALPLATPPPGMRAAILRATIGAQAAAPVFAMWEIALVGTALAVAVWLTILVASDRALGALLLAQASASLHALADPATLLWLAAGGSIAASLSLGTFGTSRRMRDGRS